MERDLPKGEYIALTIIVVGLLWTATVPFNLLPGQTPFFPTTTRDSDVRTVRVKARAEELGGFRPDKITVEKGQKVRLVVYSEDVTHGLKIENYPVELVVRPGEEESITFEADKAGDFEFKCTVYCSPLHPWMNGTLHVER